MMTVGHLLPVLITIYKMLRVGPIDGGGGRLFIHTSGFKVIVPPLFGTRFIIRPRTRIKRYILLSIKRPLYHTSPTDIHCSSATLFLRDFEEPLLLSSVR